MGNHILEQRQSQVNTTSLIMSKATVVETQKQHVGIGTTQSLNEGKRTTGVETVVAPSIDVVRRGILIESTTKLGSESCGVLAGRNLRQSSRLPAVIIGVVGIPQRCLLI